MSLKYGILSALALCVILLLILKNYEVWTHPLEFVPEKSSVERRRAKAETAPPTLIRKETPNNHSQTFLAQRNIFSPGRKDFPAPQAKRPIVRPQIALYGVTLAGDYQSACISNPGSSLRKAERETTTLRIGEKIGEYRLSKILPDRIALEAMEDSFEVLLYDPAKPKKRIYTKIETKPATVTGTASASSRISSQEFPKPVQPITARMLRTQMPQSAPAAPSPSPRSRRAASYAPGEAPTPPSPATPIGPPRASTGSSVGSFIGSQTSPVRAEIRVPSSGLRMLRIAAVPSLYSEIGNSEPR